MQLKLFKLLTNPLPDFPSEHVRRSHVTINSLMQLMKQLYADISQMTSLNLSTFSGLSVNRMSCCQFGDTEAGVGCFSQQVNRRIWYSHLVGLNLPNCNQQINGFIRMLTVTQSLKISI